MLVPHVQESGEVWIKNTRDFAELNLRLGYTLNVKHDFSMEIFGGVQNMFNSFQKDLDRGPLRDSNYIYGPTKPRTFTLGVRIGHFH